MKSWHPDSWRDHPAAQQPSYPDLAALGAVRKRLSELPTLVTPREIDRLRAELAEVAQGRAFLLQGGDCAESFAEFSERNLLSYYRLMLQMAVTLVYGVQRPVVKVGRIAGQFAKPRSEPMEVRGSERLPSYRGDMINSIGFTARDRQPDPQRLLDAYWQAGATLNYLHALSRSGYSALHNVSQWNLEFIESAESQRYQEIVDRIRDYIAFAHACGVTREVSAFAQTDFYTSHEALVLDYESALVRQHEGKFYAGSAHFVWVGNRTRDLNSAHLEFVRGIENPIGVKVGPGLKPDELLQLLDRVDPKHVPGKVTLISRMGREHIIEHLPPLIEATRSAGRAVVWACDPMHGNTVKSNTGYKTRRFEDIHHELQSFFRIHRELGTHAGGMHLELTGQDVTECTGGMQAIPEDDLNQRYHTHCDPRLNATQSLELVFLAAEQLR